VGFDDIESASYFNPSLTTISQPLHRMGMVAAHILLQQIRGNETLAQLAPILPQLVIRDSTCPPIPKRTRWQRG
jgi:LacI family transcriptional regulator